ncbi:MAG: ACP S-malonyltransferase, partial [Clostridia bacterium]|nr:ACP S-malonyltransferase [Clostridia bacterium]
ELFFETSDNLHIDLARLCFEENDNLIKTEYTQCALVAVCTGILKVIQSEGLDASAYAGLSLGEYCAVVGAGAMSAEEAVLIARTRGRLMEEAVQAGKGAMAAVLGLEDGAVENAVKSIENVWVANYNCPGQTVITGELAAVNTACEMLLSMGAKRALPLNVSGPFHSPMLKDAGDKLFDELEKINFQELKKPYATNVTGEYVWDCKKISKIFSKQVYNSVLWSRCVDTMLRDGINSFVEIGPGKTVCGFIKRIKKDMPLFNVETVEDFKKFIELFK